MKKTITIIVLALVTGACILFACKKSQTQSSLSANLNAKGRLSAQACSFVTLTGVLTTQTLVNTNVYKINGIVRIPSGVTLTIPAGTKLMGITSSTDPAYLVVEKGGKLIATGTSSNPIVFTSDQAAGSRTPASRIPDCRSPCSCRRKAASGRGC